MKRMRGFTLIELMIGIAILAIILGLGVPSFMDAIERNRVTTATNDLVMALQMARSEAIKRRTDVTVCRRNAAGTACENGTDWANGWLVSAPPGGVLRVWNPAAGQTILGPDAGASFSPIGTVRPLPPPPGHCLTLTRNAHARFVTVSTTGRVAVFTDRNDFPPLPPPDWDSVCP